MKQIVTLIWVTIVLGFAACEKATPTPDPFVSNAFAHQNDSNQQFIYTLGNLDNDSLFLNFRAVTNYEDVPGIINFYVLYTDTMDTLWLDTRSNYGYFAGDEIGDKYRLDTTAKNYVLFENNHLVYDISHGVFEAQFIIDTSIISKIDTLSPDTMRIDSGSFSGVYFE